MTKSISRFTRLTGSLVAGALLNAVVAFAADTPAQPEANAPAPAAPPANPPVANAGPGNPGNPGGRGGRGGGNFQGGNFQGGNFGGRGNFGGGWGLDDKQTELLREAMQVDSDEVRKLDEKLRAAQKELVQAVLAEKYDEKVVREKAEIVARIQTDITMLRAKALATVAPTLKPEQRDQWESSQIAIGLLMRGGGGFGGGPGGGGFVNANNAGFGGGRGNAGFGGGRPGGGPADAGFGGGGFRNGGNGGPPDAQTPDGGRGFRRNNNGDPNAVDQRRRRGDRGTNP